MLKYALVIANNQYQDQGLAQLTAPGQDAQDFARVLQDKEIGAFDDVQILFNQTESQIREAIDGFFAHKKSDDLLVLYFSGHGVRDEQGLLYLAVTNTNRARLRSTGIKSDFIRESMDQSRSRRQVLILDCCNSGAFAQGTKGVVGDAIGTGAAFEGTGFGRVVLTATDATQFAWEGDQIIGESNTQNSLFTHFLVKGLEGEADHDGDGKISVDELYDYAYEQIVSITPRQTPGKWSYKQQGEIFLRQTVQGVVRPAALPAELLLALESSYPNFREAAVSQLGEILSGKNPAMALSARMALERLAVADDSRRVAQAAAQVLSAQGTVQTQGAKSAGEESLPAPQRISIRHDPADVSSASSATFSKQKTLIVRPGWIVAFWIMLIWLVGFMVVTVGGILTNYALQAGFGDLAGLMISSALGGIGAGLTISLTMRQAGVLVEWKSLLIIPFSFLMGLLISTYIGSSIGNMTGDSSAYIYGFTLGGAVGGALAGIGIVVAMLNVYERIAWQNGLWIVGSHALALSLGLMVFNLLFQSIEYQLGTVPGAVVISVFSGTIAGVCAGTGLIFALRKEAR